MFIVPVAGDKIKTRDSSESVIVTSYTSLKSQPAVYVKDAAEPFIYFSDIVEINGVRVELSDSNVFNSLGPVRRRYNLPQPKDTITVALVDKFDSSSEQFEVTSLKLHSKQHGVDQGLVACVKEGCFNLSEITDIIRHGVFEKFDRREFARFYIDYFPIRTRVKR